MTNGDCFPVALTLVCTNPDAILCHGTVVGNGGDVVGERYDHAWVELDGPQGPICIDRSRGQDLVAYRGDYYAAGKVEYVTRYKLSDALANMRRTNTSGPWSTPSE